MRSLTLKLFGNKERGYDLRCYDDAPASVLPVVQHPLPVAKLAQIITVCESHYRSTAPALDQLGRELYQWLELATGGSLSHLRGEAFQVALHLDCGADLRHPPWELLHDGTGYLCADPSRLFTPVHRASNFHHSPRQPVNRCLRVLFMASSPLNAKPVLKFEAEEAQILTAASHAGIELVVEESGSLAGLQRIIDDYPDEHFDVVHISGHADVSDGQAIFWLEDDFGCKQVADAGQIARAFGNRFPRLLFLSGCRTGAAPAHGIPSLCEALVRAGLPAVLGWTLPVGDTDATSVAGFLYDRLATGRRLDEAVAWARQRLYENNSRYWHLLRLYSDAAPLLPLVTPRNTAGRGIYRMLPAAQDFLDAEKRIRVCDRYSFVGRRRLLQCALRALHAMPGEVDYTPGILLHGTGGLGKSSLAARLCDRLRPSHQHIVWDGCIDETEITRRFTQHVNNPDASALLADIRLPLAQRLSIFFANYIPRPLLLVFDDFEQNAEAKAVQYGQRFVPRLNVDGSIILRPEAETALRAVLEAVVSSGAETRVLVTCRQVIGGLPLQALSLSSLHGAELAKKIDNLAAFARASQVPEALRVQALATAAGNPRLLEWLDKVLLDTATDSAALLSRIDQTAVEFREDALLEELLDQLPRDVRHTLALLNIYQLPVPEAALAALDEAQDFPVRVRRLVALGLAEKVLFPDAMTSPYYYVSQLLAPLLANEIDNEGRRHTIPIAARVLHQLWWKEREEIDEAQALELRRLAHAARDQNLAAFITNSIAVNAIKNHRYREAKRWCEETLKHGEDYHLLHSLARAESVLGEGDVRAHYELALRSAVAVDGRSTMERKELSAIQNNLASFLVQQGDPARALQLWEESLRIMEEDGDVQGKASTLTNMAGVIAQQGDPARALQLWGESLTIKKRIGDRDTAATLNNMAGVIAQQGDPARALQLWEESLVIIEQIGDVQGKAATLNNMARVIARQGDPVRALQLWGESLVIIEQIGTVRGKAATLANMAEVIARQGDSARALQLWEESLKIKEQIGDVRGKATTLHNMAGVIAQQGDPARALQLWGESMVIIEQIGDIQGKATTLSSMAVVIAQQGDPARALQLWKESLVIQEQIGDVRGKASTLYNMARVIAQQGDPARARNCGKSP